MNIQTLQQALAIVARNGVTSIDADHHTILFDVSPARMSQEDNVEMLRLGAYVVEEGDPTRDLKVPVPFFPHTSDRAEWVQQHYPEWLRVAGPGQWAAYVCPY